MPESVKVEMIQLLPRLRAFARGLTGNATLADDLVQQTCERALRGLHGFTPGSRLDSWLFRIMRNSWIDTVRSQAADPASSQLDDVLQPMGEDGRDIAHARLELEAVERAMATLPEDQQIILRLVCVEGMRYRDAAEALDLPIGTVMSRLSRARVALGEALGLSGKGRQAERQ